MEAGIHPSSAYQIANCDAHLAVTSSVGDHLDGGGRSDEVQNGKEEGWGCNVAFCTSLQSHCLISI